MAEAGVEGAVDVLPDKRERGELLMAKDAACLPWPEEDGGRGKVTQVELQSNNRADSMTGGGC